MERIDKLLSHPLFLRHLEQNGRAEEGRLFCRHDLAHFLDVARIAQICNLEERLGLDRELVYGTALLHDIGRHLQYTQGIPHEQASAAIAPDILRDCGFSQKETAVMTEAILAHRNSDAAGQTGLAGLLYRADKLSRPCFGCGMQAACNWKEGRKNLRIAY